MPNYPYTLPAVNPVFRVWRGCVAGLCHNEAEASRSICDGYGKCYGGVWGGGQARHGYGRYYGLSYGDEPQTGRAFAMSVADHNNLPFGWGVKYGLNYAGIQGRHLNISRLVKGGYGLHYGLHYGRGYWFSFEPNPNFPRYVDGSGFMALPAYPLWQHTEASGGAMVAGSDFPVWYNVTPQLSSARSYMAVREGILL